MSTSQPSPRAEQLKRELEAQVQRVNQAIEGAPFDANAFTELVECLRIYQAELEQQNLVLFESNTENEMLRQHYASLFALLPIPTLIIDKKLNISESNQAAKELLKLNQTGHDKHLSFVGLFQSAALNQLNQSIARCAQDKSSETLRITNPIKGHEAVYDLHISHVSNVKTKAIKFLVLLQDVTATTRFVQQQTLLNSVIEHSIDSVLILSTQMEVRVISKDLLRLFQLPEDLPNEQLLRRLPAELSKLLNEFVTHGPDTAELNRTIELLIPDMSDSVFVNIHGFFVEQDDEPDPCAGFIIRDETYRIRQENNLALALRIFDQGEQALMVTDANLNIVQVNSAFESLTGHNIDTAAQLKLQELGGKRSHKPKFGDAWELAKQNGKWEGEISGISRHDSGSLYWMNISSYPKHSDSPTHFISVFHDITKQRKNEEEINRLAYFDSLTGCGNRRLLNMHINRMMEAEDASFSLFFFDLDLFKQVNDIHGHQTGDRLLQALINRLKHLIRDTDQIYRLGGDEFLILFQELELHDIGNKASALIEASSTPFFVEEHQLNISISLGIVRFPDDGHDFETLLKHADIALYQAKENGRRGYQFFDPELLSLMTRKVQVEKHLRQGLKNGELWCAYMPQYSIAEEKYTQAELLVRWDSPVLGEVHPDEFIPVAEQTGLIKSISRFVVSTALRDIPKLPNDMQVSINVSPLDFKDDVFFNELMQLLSAATSRPLRLTLELTEHMLIDNVEQTRSKLARLKSIGAKIAVDDFGTGYSSLNYLASFPIDELKIDRAFVDKVPEDHTHNSICVAILSLAKALACSCVAEGVEDQAQLGWLEEQGCDYSQGFLHSKPLDIDTLLQFLADG